MSSVSAILSQLEGTEMLEEHAMDRALNKLLMNFRDERRLVLQCQSSGIAAMFFCSPPSKLSKQLRVELDAMVSDINAIIAVIVNHTLDPQRNARGQPQAPPSVQPARINDLPEYWVCPPHRLST
ncbi:hypothetical protein SORBI_3008G173500 [Sorghum bicolor]|uniref:Uncharacterized protein n=1 Tax=Sorghum bicolor TaxID=4558 RepID=A0A1B6PE84_SORBI|nr:hypothetical protein SORBI_3008G173500 [Sorghum bicolor]